MRKLPILLGLFAAFATPVLATEDPIATRQALMDNNGASAAVAGAMMKGEVAYSPVVGKAVFAAMAATAQAFGDYFPEGSANAEHSDAAPKIWEDKAGFEAELAKFRKATSAAVEASGKTGPADQAAFMAAAKPVLDSCKSCHEAYRLDD